MSRETDFTQAETGAVRSRNLKTNHKVGLHPLWLRTLDRDRQVAKLAYKDGTASFIDRIHRRHLWKGRWGRRWRENVLSRGKSDGKRPCGFCSLDYYNEKGYSARKSLVVPSRETEVCLVVADVQMTGILMSSGLVLGDLAAYLYLLDFSFSMFFLLFILRQDLTL